MKTFALFLFSNLTLAEEAVDLSALGMSDFSPYLVEREPLWILLPLAVLALVFVHLIKPNRRKNEKST